MFHNHILAMSDVSMYSLKSIHSHMSLHFHISIHFHITILYRLTGQQFLSSYTLKSRKIGNMTFRYQDDEHVFATLLTQTTFLQGIIPNLGCELHDDWVGGYQAA